MNPSIQEKLEHLAERQEEINALLSNPSVIAPQVLPHPSTNSSPDSSPITSRSGMVSAMPSIFFLRRRHMWSWLAGS